MFLYPSEQRHQATKHEKFFVPLCIRDEIGQLSKFWILTFGYPYDPIRPPINAPSTIPYSMLV